jgi:hypothetical protein
MVGRCASERACSEGSGSEKLVNCMLYIILCRAQQSVQGRAYIRHIVQRGQSGISVCSLLFRLESPIRRRPGSDPVKVGDSVDIVRPVLVSKGFAHGRLTTDMPRQEGYGPKVRSVQCSMTGTEETCSRTTQ